MLGWLMIAAFALLFIGITGPWSPLRFGKIKNSEGKIKFAILATLLFVQCILVSLVFIVFHNQDGAWGVEVVTDTMQYQHVADALLEGRPYLTLDYGVPDWLANAADSYDYDFRLSMGAQTGQPSYFDYAFYNGKYYSYFGFLPALILFAPFKALTGIHLSTWAATFIFGIFVTVASNVLTYALFSRKLNWATWADYILGSMFIFLATGVLQLAVYSSFYHIAILCALGFAMLGVALWLLSIGKDKELNKPLLVIGSCCAALTLLARPALMLCCVLAFPIFSEHIKGCIKQEDGSIVKLKQRQFFAANRTALINTLCVILPFVITATIAMAWNYARFGSPLDFGSNYNLTGFNMTTKRVSKRGVLASLLLFYVIGPVDFTKAFPYIRHYICVATNSLGIPVGQAWFDYELIVEPYFGGFLCTLPLGLLLFAIPLKRKHMKSEDLFYLSLTSILLALGIALVDSTVAVTQRYQSDFFWLFAIATLCVLTTFKKEQAHKRSTSLLKEKVLQLLPTLLVIYSCVWTFFNLMCANRYNAITEINPDVYTVIAGLFS